MKGKKADIVRSSAAEYLTFVADAGNGIACIGGW